MAGETDLSKLLADLRPELTPDEFVFVSLETGRYGDLAELQPLASFSEPEGLSLVIRREQAAPAGLSYEGVFRCITLRIHSSLEAVGLTAAISAALTEKNISANVIAACYHDHVLVPAERVEEALVTLSGIRSSAAI